MIPYAEKARRPFLASHVRMSPPIMSGGAKEHMTDIIKKYTKPLSLYIGLTLILGIVYVRQIPARIRMQGNTMIGRALLFCLTLLIADMYSWTYGIMMALFAMLLLAVSPRIEGFLSEDATDIKMVTLKRRWFSEQILNENPAGISEDKVTTSAIQDQGNSASTHQGNK
jgi:hypothetical protein